MRIEFFYSNFSPNTQINSSHNIAHYNFKKWKKLASVIFCPILGSLEHVMSWHIGNNQILPFLIRVAPETRCSLVTQKKLPINFQQRHNLLWLTNYSNINYQNCSPRSGVVSFSWTSLRSWQVSACEQWKKAELGTWGYFKFVCNEWKWPWFGGRLF